MKEIQVAISHANDTLAEAKEYYHDYTIFKDNPLIAKTLLEMAKTHIDLYNKWHSTIVNLIEDYKSKGKTIPEDMKKIYDYEHQKLVEKFDELKYKIDHA